MAPPVYGDLGKSAKDVFGKGYHFGVLKLECKSKTNTGVEITAGGSNALESGKVAGNLETKYKVKEHGKLQAGFVVCALVHTTYSSSLFDFVCRKLDVPGSRQG